MNLTQNEIAAVRDRLREEIMDRECLLAALDVYDKYAANGNPPVSMQLSNLVAGLLPSRPAVEFKELPASPAPPAPGALPSTPPVERYVHPELTHSQFSGHGSTAALVGWAVERMASDFSLNDVDTMLKREGKPISRPAISVVLTRLKRRGEIEEIQSAAGPYPAVYRNPNLADEAQAELTDQRKESAPTADASDRWRKWNASPAIKRELFPNETLVRHPVSTALHG